MKKFKIGFSFVKSFTKQTGNRNKQLLSKINKNFYSTNNSVSFNSSTYLRTLNSFKDGLDKKIIKIPQNIETGQQQLLIKNLKEETIKELSFLNFMNHQDNFEILENEKKEDVLYSAYDNYNIIHKNCLEKLNKSLTEIEVGEINSGELGKKKKEKKETIGIGEKYTTQETIDILKESEGIMQEAIKGNTETEISSSEWGKFIWNCNKLKSSIQTILTGEAIEVLLPIKLFDIAKIKGHFTDLTEGFTDYKEGDKKEDLNKKKKGLIRMMAGLAGLASIIAFVKMFYKKRQEYLALVKYKEEGREKIVKEFNKLKIGTLDSNSLKESERKKKEAFDELNKYSSGLINALDNLISNIKKIVGIVELTNLEKLIKKHTECGLEVEKIQAIEKQLAKNNPDTVLVDSLNYTIEQLEIHIKEFYKVWNEAKVEKFEDMINKTNKSYEVVKKIKFPDFSFEDNKDQEKKKE